MSENEAERMKRMHKDIEAERRAKATQYYNELFQLLPLGNNSKKTKIHILEHVTNHIVNEENQKCSAINRDQSTVSFLTNQQLNELILEACSGFVFVVECDTDALNLIYVSASIESILGYKPIEWLHKNLVDFVYENDKKRVKDQLCIKENLESHKIMDHITGQNLSKIKTIKEKNLMTRRGFICKIKNKFNSYSLMHITGCAKNAMHEAGVNQKYLVASARLYQSNDAHFNQADPKKFATRHDQSGNIIYVDANVTNLLGYRPNDMLNKEFCQFCIESEQIKIRSLFKNLKDSKSTDKIQIPINILSLNNQVISLQTEIYSFRNPHNEEIEFIVATHTIKDFNISNENFSLKKDNQNVPNRDEEHIDIQTNLFNEFWSANKIIE